MTTIKCLESLCEQINKLTDSPLTSSTRVDGNYVTNVGNYHLSQAYGGVCIHRMVNTSGGVSEPIFTGHRPKREAELAIRSFLRGLEVRITEDLAGRATL